MLLYYIVFNNSFSFIPPRQSLSFTLPSLYSMQIVFKLILLKASPGLKRNASLETFFLFILLNIFLRKTHIFPKLAFYLCIPKALAHLSPLSHFSVSSKLKHLLSSQVSFSRELWSLASPSFSSFITFSKEEQKLGIL